MNYCPWPFLFFQVGTMSDVKPGPEAPESSSVPLQPQEKRKPELTFEMLQEMMQDSPAKKARSTDSKGNYMYLYIHVYVCFFLTCEWIDNLTSFAHYFRAWGLSGWGCRGRRKRNNEKLGARGDKTRKRFHDQTFHLLSKAFPEKVTDTCIYWNQCILSGSGSSCGIGKCARAARRGLALREENYTYARWAKQKKEEGERAGERMNVIWRITEHSEFSDQISIYRSLSPHQENFFFCEDFEING